MNARRFLPFVMLLLGWSLLAVAEPATAPGRRPFPATQALRKPASRPADIRPIARLPRPTTQVSEADRQKFLNLTRQAIQQIQAGKLDDAEKSLDGALALFPSSPTNIYNLGCVKALKGQSDAALDQLERAALEGFTDFGHIDRDPDLKSLRTLPRYRQFMSRRDEFQRKAASRVVDWLKREFGEGYIYEIDEKDKLIFATNTDAQTLADLKRSLLQQANSQWAELFGKKPDQYITIALPSLKDFRQIVQRPGVGGFYNHENRILIAQRLGQVMTHEFTHALHDADITPLGQQHPIWLTEGLATLYESSRFEGQKLVPNDGFRLLYVQNAAKGNKLIPFEKLMKMDQRTFISNPMVAYGESGSVMHYLYDRKLLRKFYDAFKAGFEKDKTGIAALEHVTGRKLAEIESDWKAWMLARKPPGKNAGPDGPFLGIQFADATDGVRVAQVVPNGPAAKHGVKAGDVLVGINDLDIRDQQSLIPYLQGYRAGDEVVLRLRRTQEYLSLPVVLARRDAVVKPATQPVTRPR